VYWSICHVLCPTATVVHSITVSYSGPGCTCGVVWLDCVSSGLAVLPSEDVLEDRLCLQHKQMQTMITKVGTSKLKSTSETTTLIGITLLELCVTPVS
jgi:hypothetical protein